MIKAPNKNKEQMCLNKLNISSISWKHMKHENTEQAKDQFKKKNLVLF